jgi:hypothetical protein
MINFIENVILQRPVQSKGAGKETSGVPIIISMSKERGLEVLEISFVQNFGFSIYVRSVGTLAISVKQRCAV